MKPKLRKLSFFVAAACAANAQGAYAETVLKEVVVKEQADQGGSYEAIESAAATKIAVPLRDVPQAVNVVPKAVMRDQNALSVQDALQNVPGLSFSVGDGQRDQVTIRGFMAINDQFVDGVRDDALYFRDLSNIERVEVLKGPASVLYGRGSAGGLINRVTKKPSEKPIMEVGGTLGSQGQKRGEFDIGSTSSDKQTQFRLTGALEDSTGFRHQYFLERQVVAPSVTFKLKPTTTLTLQADYLKDKRLADQGVPSFRGRPVEVPIETYYGAANGRERAFVQSEVASTTVTLDHAFHSGLKLHSVLRGYNYSLDRNYTTINKVTANPTARVTIAQTRRLRDEDGYFFQNEISQKAQWGGTQHQILYGLELGQQHKSELLSSRNNAATYDLFNPVLVTLPPLPATIIPSADNKSRINIAALYLQDLVTLSPQWKVLGGLRYDQLRQKRDDRTARNVDLERTDNTLSPRLGAVYQPTEQVSLYTAYSRSFQPISDSFVFNANSDQFKPTQTQNKEVGIKLDIGAKASLTAALFDMSQTNIQVADPANPGFALPVGKQRTRGLELTFTGEIAPQWEMISGYSYMEGRITESTERTSAGTPFQGNTAALTPRHSLNLWVKRKFNDGYYVAAGGRAESARYASPDNLTVLPGYGVINLGAGHEEKKYDVAITLKNLFNRKYYVAAHSGANDYNMPGEPRSLLVSARYRF
ncbi:TonB-dependent receptor [Limnohabitans planktonicus]|uniref:TonB-dependent siderophore receptor n=1 Tax=Limnohabitans planktonicus II-D5 TaxID=1293045 RepID=A0A2T7UGP0_9BURK|nr:TonB-dependent siderophore receptor [Limnohabitans planktonicus]PVE43869.1 TonB-dependent siderophore receptor [Limnohabitans planktonicus II-D5]